MSTFYGNETGFAAYCDLRDLEPLAGDVPAALLVASEWLDGRYSGAWAGTGTRKTGGRIQEREWPRVGFQDAYGDPISKDEIPREVVMATYEAAIRHLNNPGSLSTDFKASASYKSVSIDGAVSVEFNGSGTVEDAQITIPVIDAILRPLMGLGGGSLYSGPAIRV